MYAYSESELIRNPPGKAGAALRYLINSPLKDNNESFDLSQCVDQEVHRSTKSATISRLL